MIPRLGFHGLEVFRIWFRCKIGFQISSGNAQFPTKSLKLIDQVNLFKNMYGVKGKLCSTGFTGMAIVFLGKNLKNLVPK